MRRVETLIDIARELTQNTRFDADSGVPQKVFVRYFQNAQDAITRALAHTKTKYFLGESVLTVVSGQEEYSYPSDIFLRSIDTMEFSIDGIDYYPLLKLGAKERAGSGTSDGFGYILRSSGFLVTPKISSGFLRVNYIRNPKRIEKRSGKISAVTVNGSNQITAMTLSAGESSFDSTYLNLHEFLCVVSRTGESKVKNLGISDVNSSTGVVTLSPSNHSLGTGESVAVNDFVVAGRDAQNISEMPEIAEQFLIQNVIYQAKFGDSSQWTAAAKNEVKEMLSELMINFGMMSDDITEIAIIDDAYLCDEENY